MPLSTVTTTPAGGHSSATHGWQRGRGRTVSGGVTGCVVISEGAASARLSIAAAASRAAAVHSQCRGSHWPLPRSGPRREHIISAATSDPPNPFCNSIFLVRPRALCRRAIIDFDASGRLASRDAAQIVPQPHPTSWPSCPVEIAALAAPYLLPRSSWSSRQPPNANECPRRAPRGQTRAHGTQSICRHRGNREAHRRRARTARESNCAAPALDQPSAAVASRGGPADCACADSRGCLTRDGCAIHRHANLDAHLLLRAAEPKNR